MEPIAIVGMGCRIADTKGPEEFFKLLCAGVDATRATPADRWNVETFFDSERGIPGKLTTKRGGFLSEIDKFDAEFFGISPREAACMDPQQRMMLEVTWEALEDSGVLPESLSGGNTGVFVGAFTLDYKALQMSPSNLDLIDAHTATGSMMTMVSNRVSYMFDLRGPSMSIDTACSSSLVAIHLACQSLRSGECSVALAGGVNAIIVPEHTIAESKGGFLAPDGRSKPFSALANGYGRGEGAGMVVLKPLAAAIAAGDAIYAVVRGSAVNQDGRTNGITVPRGEAQEALIREACLKAGVTPGQLQYVEAHGTGTPVGDPIEAKALGSALSQGRPDGETCLVGSVKGNIGHLEAAAGIAGLIKTAMCIRHKRIPPNLHFEQPNPSIPFESLRLQMPRSEQAWPACGVPALAGVNSFGFGGTNAHVVLEEMPALHNQEEGCVTEQRARVFPISARNPEAMKAFAQSYLTFLREGEESLEDIYYSASQRRTHHDHRLAVTAGSKQELAENLERYLAGENVAGISSGSANAHRQRKLAWVFTGMGPQWWAMGRQLFECETVFREALLECDALFRTEANWSLLDEMLAGESESRMAETQVAQTANFAIQMALARLWNSWGIKPDAIVGHSVGEVAAAYISGALSLRDAIRVSFHRSRLQQKVAGKGAMLATGLGADEAANLLKEHGERVSVAAVNGPKSTTLSGDPEDLKKLAQDLTDRGVFNRMLKVDVAYHSCHMDSLESELLESLKDLQPQSAQTPLYSTVTGGRVDGGEWNAGYWWMNVRKPVLFSKATETLLDEGYDLFLEVGPHPVLSTSIAECVAHSNKPGASLPSLRRGQDESQTILSSLGTLYTAGFQVRWEGFSKASAKFVRLPAYPWQRQRYWSESDISRGYRIGVPGHPLLGERRHIAHPVWNVQISTANLPYLKDHRIQNATVFPGAGYVEMGLAAAREVFGGESYSVEDIRFRRALFLPEKERPKVQIALDRDAATFQIHTVPGSVNQPWVLNASGRIQQSQRIRPELLELAEIQRRCANKMTGADCYQKFREQGFEYGPAFQRIDAIWVGDGEALARFGELPPDAKEYQLHPAFLDGCFQTLVATDPFRAPVESTRRTYLPVGITSIRQRRRASGELWAHARLTRKSDGEAQGDIIVTDSAGEAILEILGFQVQALDQAEGAVSEQQIDKWLYTPEWETTDAAAAQPARERGCGTWLILADEKGTGAALAGRLEALGHKTVLVRRGVEYSAQGASYTVDPKEPEHFKLLLHDLASCSAGLQGIAHCWSLDAPSTSDLTSATLAAGQQSSCLSLLYLMQSLTAAAAATRVWVVTSGAQPVRQSDAALNLAQAAIWGMGRVIGHQECSQLWGGLIDLDQRSSPDDCEVLLGEVLSDGGEDQIAFRNGQRYVARLNRTTNLTRSLSVHLRSDCAYVITGGLGALGLLTARWMITQGARRLILMGRTALPQRALWSQPGLPATASQRIAAILELERMGASITIAPVDVADEKELSTFLDQYQREGWPAIRGVVHSAGIVHDKLLDRMDAAAFTSVTKPKIDGAWNLHRLLNPKDLDFFVLFSSIGSLVASPGQVNYAAGNAFLDALAHYRRSLGLPCLSINWGPWAVGMVKDLNLVDYYRRQGLEVVSAQQGMQVLSRLFGQQQAQAAVLDANWPLAFELRPRVPAMLAHLAQVSEEGDTASANATHSIGIIAQLLLAEPAGRVFMLEAHLQDLTAKVLRLERSRIDLNQPLTSLGLDSLMASELKARIEVTLGTPVSVLDLLKGITLFALAADILTGLFGEEDAELASLLAEVEALPADLVELLPGVEEEETQTVQNFQA